MPKLKEMLADAKGRLADANAAVENGEEGAVEALEACIGEVKSIQARIDAAKDGAALLESLGSGEGEADAEDPGAKSLGDHFVKSSAGHLRRGEKFAFTAPAYGEKDDPAVMMLPTGAGTYADTLTTIRPDIIEGYRHDLVFADLFGSQTVTNGNSVTYFVENANVVGGFAAVAEGAEKPMMSFGDPVEVNETLKKIAGYYKVSDELLEDAPRLANAINGRALYMHDVAEETQLISGSGTGANIRGLLNRSGIQTLSSNSAKEIDFDTILDAISAVENATGFNADAIVMNIADYNAMRKTKDGNGQYLAGGPFTGQYGNGTIQAKPSPWGVPVYTTPAIEKGTAIVGAFKLGGTVYRKAGTTVAVYNQNEDDAIHNRITIVVESRLALGVEYPAAFVKVTYKA